MCEYTHAHCACSLASACAHEHAHYHRRSCAWPFPACTNACDTLRVVCVCACANHRMAEYATLMAARAQSTNACACAHAHYLDHLLAEGLGFEGALCIPPKNALSGACAFYRLHRRKGRNLVGSAQRRPLGRLVDYVLWRQLPSPGKSCCDSAEAHSCPARHRRLRPPKTWVAR